MARYARKSATRRRSPARGRSRSRSSGYRAGSSRRSGTTRRRAGSSARTVRIELVTTPANPVARPETLRVEDKGSSRAKY